MEVDSQAFAARVGVMLATWGCLNGVRARLRNRTPGNIHNRKRAPVDALF